VDASDDRKIPSIPSHVHSSAMRYAQHLGHGELDRADWESDLPIRKKRIHLCLALRIISMVSLESAQIGRFEP
jgi:hypothetical protein